jgi:ATP-dependent DNA helicase RecG
VTPLELRERLVRGEDAHTDVKRQLGSNEELAKDLVCFANGDGGQIILGVADDLRVVGVGDPESIFLAVDDVAFQRCRPPVSVALETVDLPEGRVVVVHVARGDQRPYATSSGRYYIRRGVRCRDASREELLRLFQAGEDLYVDEQPLNRLNLTDLDLDAVTRHVASVGLDAADSDDLPGLLRSWRLYDGSHPTVAGMVLFGRRPQEHLEASRVVVAAFAGTDSGDDLSDRADITGGLIEVIERVQGFLDLHLPTSHVIRGFEPERRPEIPPAALREAVVNALVHRDYTIGGPVRVFVFRDRVEVHSPGRPPNSVDADAMRAGAHVPRNPHIYARVADMQLATRAGTGIRRIARLLREDGRQLGLTVSDAEVVLTMPRPPRDEDR